jgi:osmoprotectant transport system ATP-binding protein
VIELEHVSKRYDGMVALDDISLTVGAGELFVLVGPSGSGKSTLLKAINRMVTISGGAIRFAGADVASYAPEALRRRIGYVIQSVGLFPHWTIERNIGAVPELLGWPRPRIAARTTELMTLLGLDPERTRALYPHQLSGGQQQRVGVARALAADPEMLLMDEPFGALDPLTREALQSELLALHRNSGKTIVLVTHDMDEALRLATRLAILEDGRLTQLGTPAEILAHPATPLVRRFVGGADHALKLLAFETVADRMRPGESAQGEPLPATATLRDALAAMIARGATALPVIGGPAGVGAIRLEDLVRR